MGVGNELVANGAMMAVPETTLIVAPVPPEFPE